jgi:hypothetical protein
MTKDQEYYAQYSFIYDDIKLCAEVNSNGRQNLIMKHLDKNGDLLFSDKIPCIHTAIVDIHADKLQSTLSEDDGIKNILNARSIDDLHEVDLSNDEKFKAFKSWVAGIAEAGVNSIVIQQEIEEYAKFMYPIMNFILGFLVKAKPEFFEIFLENVEKQCKYNGTIHKSSLWANLLPFIQFINNNCDETIENQFKEINRGILSIASDIYSNYFIKEIEIKSGYMSGIKYFHDDSWDLEGTNVKFMERAKNGKWNVYYIEKSWGISSLIAFHEDYDIFRLKEDNEPNLEYDYSFTSGHANYSGYYGVSFGFYDSDVIPAEEPSDRHNTGSVSIFNPRVNDSEITNAGHYIDVHSDMMLQLNLFNGPSKTLYFNDDLVGVKLRLVGASD